ncbi:MAG: type II toxin-antitoxin system prevent-host-death family antitoxin [Xanthobacteraceae bacterium]
MKHVGMFEAKTNLSSLVEEVEKGGEVVLTRHGKPVARLVQMNHAERPYTAEEVAGRRRALEEIRAIADTFDVKLTREEIKARIREGQR